MGYRIQYGPKKERPFRRKLAYLGLCIFAVAFTIRILGLHEQVGKLLIPGDPAVTAAAWERLISSIRSGGQLSDGIYVFCQEIIAGAGLY